MYDFRKLLIYSLCLFFISCDTEDINPSTQEEANIESVGLDSATELLDKKSAIKKMLLAINEIRSEGCTCGDKEMLPVKGLNLNNDLVDAIEIDIKNILYEADNTNSTDDKIEEIENMNLESMQMDKLINAWLNNTENCYKVMRPQYTVASVGNDLIQILAQP